MAVYAQQPAAAGIGVVITGGTIGSRYGEDEVVRLRSARANAELEFIRAADPVEGGGICGFGVR